MIALLLALAVLGLAACTPSPDKPALVAQCKADGEKLYATAPDRYYVLLDHIETCMTAKGYGINPATEECSAGPARERPACYQLRKR